MNIAWMKLPGGWRVWLVVAGGLCLVFAGVGAWVVRRAMDPECLSLSQVRESLVAGHDGDSGRVVGWGSERFGFDDGADWIEFDCDRETVERLLRARSYVVTDAGDPPTVEKWAEDRGAWGEEHRRFVDESGFADHGTSYYLFVVDREAAVRVLLARTQQ